MKKTLEIILGILLGLTGLNALVAGALFIADPSGAKLGMNVSMLSKSPFSDFLLPGIVLFAVNGLGQSAGLALLIAGHRLAKSVILALGTVLCGWIAVQAFWVEFSFLQPVIFVFGAAECLIAAVLLRRARALKADTHK